MDLRQAVTAYVHRASGSKWFQALGIAILVFVIYFITSKGSTPHNHYVRLADAFLDGRLYLVDAPPWLELIRYGEKGFVINPPAPTLFLLPWVAIWGISTNQAIVSMMVGAGAMGLFWVVATQLGWSLSVKAAITLLLAFGLALAAMGGAYLLYTYGEYGTFTLGYERGQFVDEPWFSQGLFDISYIPRQLNAILFYVPVFTDQFPYFKPSFMGLGLFLTTPALLYMFRARLKERLSLAVLSIPGCSFAGIDSHSDLRGDRVKSVWLSLQSGCSPVSGHPGGIRHAPPTGPPQNRGHYLELWRESVGYTVFP